MATENNVRQRNPKNRVPPAQAPSTNSVSDEPEEGTRVISVLDVIRILVTLVATSLALSYYITSGESVLWGWQPWLTRPGLLKSYLKGPINLTPAELSAYDGTDPSRPIYLAINGTIFDVSAGRRTYGPGGSYHVFAGRDATRAFVTGCFIEDRTDDLRGAELTFLPVEDDELEELSSAEKKIRAERGRREAKQKVIEEVKKWESFYGNSKKYFKVGMVLNSGKHTGPEPRLCEQAEKARPRRSRMNKYTKSKEERASDAAGKPV